ncbi:uncharacterized protein [Halyomorpha halys]|uniref:uncharacterized protein n=1 Tax=Halyomorpha halys TaxID=286706 RepID=UPI0006D508C2|nr:uncharacterized protein LOC106679275 [Halyomorpha halys]
MRPVYVLLIIGTLSSALGEEETLRAIEKCGRLSEMGTCLRLRAVTLLDRALRSGPLVINDYISLAPNAVPNVTQPSSEEIEASLPKDAEEKESALDEMIADKVTTFISSRSLRLNFPGQEAQGRKSGGFGGGGGGGGKKGGGMMMMLAFAGMASWLVQMAFAKIALLAGKALLVGKMALLLSAVIGLKKLLGGEEGHDSHQVVYAQEAHHGGHGWGRSAQELAYSGHVKGMKQ